MKKITFKTKIKLIASALAITSLLSVNSKAEAKETKDDSKKEHQIEVQTRYKIEDSKLLKLVEGETHIHEYTYETDEFTPIDDLTHLRTHKKICPIDGEAISKEETEKCDFVIINKDKNYETLLCPRCGDIKKEKHAFDAGKEDEFGNITYTCKHKNCNYAYQVEKITELPDEDYDHDQEIIAPHIHSYTWTSFNESEEHGVCSCGDTLKRPHSLSDWTYSENNDRRSCSTCEYEEVRDHSHDYITTITPEKETTMCKTCGKTIVKDHNHDFSEWSYTENEGKRTCNTCGKVETVDHVHDFSEWSYTETVDERTCSVCGRTEQKEHKHDFSYTYDQDFDTLVCDTCGKVEKEAHNHKFSDWTYNIDNMDSRTCGTCGLVDQVPHNHAFSDWIYLGEGKDSRTCQTCEETEERDHIHQEKPDDLNYIFDKTNSNGTHNLTASYTCGICNEELQDTIKENCQYSGEKTYEIYSQYNSYNTHHEIDTCDVCGYRNITIGNCVKTGDLKFIKINSAIYEYYLCALCNGYVDRTTHVNHVFGEWEYDDQEHVRYCGCVEAREKGPHDYTITSDPNNPGNNIATCNICGYSKPVLDHEHAPDEMGLMDLLLSPYYDQLVSKSQIANPNPSPDDYCSRYDVYCPTCNSIYSIHYAHNFVNGICKRTGYCGGIEDPNYANTIIYNELQDTINSYNPEEQYTLTLTRKK